MVSILEINMFKVNLKLEDWFRGLEHLAMQRNLHVKAQEIRLYPDHRALEIPVSDAFAEQYPQFYCDSFTKTIVLSNQFLQQLPFEAFEFEFHSLDKQDAIVKLNREFWTEANLKRYLPNFQPKKAWLRRLFNV